MTEAIFLQDGDSIDYTPGSAVAAGDVVVINGAVGIAKRAIAANDLGALASCGVFTMLKVTGAIADKQDLYWDVDGTPVGGSTTGAVTTEAVGYWIGKAIGAAESGDTTVNVRFKQPPPGPLEATINDPGASGAIPVLRSGHVDLVTAAAETRTIPIPTYAGQSILLGFKTDGGNCVVTAAVGVNQTGNNTLTFADAGDAIELVGVTKGSALVWRVRSNDGVALTTV
jgi:predicted RecA/RadA family phage recombinase